MNRELPPWQIFKKSFVLIWERRAFALYISLPIILLSFCFGLGIDEGFLVNPFNPAKSVDPETPLFISMGVAQTLVINAIYGFLFTVLAVYWHRSILLNERSAGTFPLRFDPPVWRYILYAICVAILVFCLFLIPGIIMGFFGAMMKSSGAAIWVKIFIIPLWLFSCVIWFRLSLVLPAMAIGRSGFGFRASWHASSGYGWPILGIILIALGLSIVIGFTILIPLIMFWPQLLLSLKLQPQSVVQPITVIFAIVQSLIGLGILSLTYAYLTHEPQDTSPSGEQER